VIRILAVAFFLALVGVTYQSVGFMAMERELGMSQLMEAMMPNKRRWEPQVARLLSYHIAFDMIYLPGWIICGAIVSGLVFPDTSVRASTYLILPQILTYTVRVNDYLPYPLWSGTDKLFDSFRSVLPSSTIIWYHHYYRSYCTCHHCSNRCGRQR
jgi:hypothetical protein